MAWNAPPAPWKWGKSFSAKPKNKQPEGTEEAVAAADQSEESKSDTEQEIASEDKTPVKITTHNAELLAYINDELKDASPQERTQYLSSFKGVDPEMIKYILRTRRMVNSMQKEQLAKNDPASISQVSLPGLGHSEPGDTAAPVIQASIQQSSPPGQISPGENQQLMSSNPVQLGNLEGIGPHSENGLPAIGSPQPHAYSTSQTISQGLNHIPVVGTLKNRLSTAFQQGTSALQSGISRTSTAIIGQQENVPQTLPPTNLQIQPAVPQTAELAMPAGYADSNSSNPSSTDQLQLLISVAEAEISQLQPGSTPAEKQHFIERHVYLRMLYLMANQHERALEAIPGIDPADQEFWQQTFWAVANYFDQEAIPDQADRATQTVTQLRQATARLQEKANLSLKNVAFCHKISSFGSYERFERDEYTPGRPVLVYSEIENFTSELTADGMYRTLLKSKIQIFKAGSNGDLVAEIPFDTTEDLCRNVRKDYFHSYKFEIPRNISLGPHIMKLTVEDEISQKVATYTQNFTVR
ncbi:hypothetical protein Pan161_30330 [Gimesia algae]|uniref:Uncharacterized protein n=2 Tax=Gimesia algae TaxID=2527971 RepID=A0A517VEE8_9PLAN|nr:hypothetical protein Pan161_30330 [Gimesia algae]